MSLYVYGSNPAIVAPDSNKVREGLGREDLFTVVHDLFLTETAKYADIVLPATSSFENTDLYTSYWHHYAQIQQPVIDPFEESKSNVEVFRLLAKEMGFNEPAFSETEVEMIDLALDNQHNPFIEKINYEAITKTQYVKANAAFPAKLPTPSGKIELYSEKMKKDGYPPLPTYIPIVNDGEFSYSFVPAPNHNFLNSTFSNNRKHIALEKEPLLHMNQQDAEREGIRDGEMVRIWNNSGECMLKVSIGDNVLTGVLVTQGLWSDALNTSQLVNSLTPSRMADMGGGATFFSGRVNICAKNNNICENSHIKKL